MSALFDRGKSSKKWDAPGTFPILEAKGVDTHQFMGLYGRENQKDRDFHFQAKGAGVGLMEEVHRDWQGLKKQLRKFMGKKTDLNG